jgi:hypothetical protein
LNGTDNFRHLAPWRTVGKITGFGWGGVIGLVGCWWEVLMKGVVVSGVVVLYLASQITIHKRVIFPIVGTVGRLAYITTMIDISAETSARRALTSTCSFARWEEDKYSYMTS